MHHGAAFALVSALVSERILSREELRLRDARRILNADRVYGIAAGVALVVGALPVAFFEKGPQSYLHSAPFIAKISMFDWATVDLPDTRVLLVAAGAQARRAAGGQREKMKWIRLVILGELACVALVILCAALMARGVGYVGS